MSDQAAIVAIIATVVPAAIGWLVAQRLRHNLREARRVRHTPAE